MSFTGRSRSPVCVRPILLMTSMPSTTSPNTVWRSSRCGVGAERNEELPAVGVGAAIGHRHDAGLVVAQLRVKLVGEVISGSADSLAERIAALDHEADRSRGGRSFRRNRGFCTFWFVRGSAPLFSNPRPSPTKFSTVRGASCSKRRIVKFPSVRHKLRRRFPSTVGSLSATVGVQSYEPKRIPLPRGTIPSMTADAPNSRRRRARCGGGRCCR